MKDDFKTTTLDDLLRRYDLIQIIIRVIIKQVLSSQWFFFCRNKIGKAYHDNDSFKIKKPFALNTKGQITVIYLIRRLFADPVQSSLVGYRIQGAVFPLGNIPESLGFFFQQSFFANYFIVFYNEACDMCPTQRGNK